MKFKECEVPTSAGIVKFKDVLPKFVYSNTPFAHVNDVSFIDKRKNEMQ